MFQAGPTLYVKEFACFDGAAEGSAFALLLRACIRSLVDAGEVRWPELNDDGGCAVAPPVRTSFIHPPFLPPLPSTFSAKTETQRVNVARGLVEASWLADACSVAAEAVETIVDDGWMYRIVADDRGEEACRRKADCAHKLLEKRSKPDTQACLPADFDALAAQLGDTHTVLGLDAF